MSVTDFKPLLYTLGVLGTAATWGRTLADGSLTILNTALSPNGTIPGTSSPVLKTFTGVPPLDHLFRTLIVFFFPVLDGSHPSSSLVGAYFAGQLFPIIIAVYLDGLRSTNGGTIVKPSLWFLVFGAAAIGSSGAVWALVYLSSSKLVSVNETVVGLQRASMFTSPRLAFCVLPAAIVGYLGPLVAMALPSPTLVSVNFQQWAIVSWNVFPVYIIGLIKLGEFIWDVLQPPKYAVMDVTQPKHAPIQLWVVRRLGIASVLIGIANHVSVTTISISSILFPALFNSQYVADLHPIAITIPPISLNTVKTLGEGIKGFMLWDQVFGYTLVLTVFLAQLRNAQRFSQFAPQRSWGRTVVWATVLSVLIGPGPTILAASWLRDEILFNENIKNSPVSKAH